MLTKVLILKIKQAFDCANIFARDALRGKFRTWSVPKSIKYLVG